ncbi:hypothetical protein AMTRI_Chr13g91980 [Amborella trichopoda]
MILGNANFTVTCPSFERSKNWFRASSLKIKGATVKSNHGKRRCACYDLYKELIPYREAWLLQKSMLEKKLVMMDRNEDDSDIAIILQHPPVYTLGTSSSEKFLNFDIQDPPYDVYRTERGGEVTYHGPGQLVIYPIINLRYHKMDLHWYLRSLEEVVIRVLASCFFINASRIEGLTGVWVGDQKIAAIGIRVSKWITYHGLALNVINDLAPFNHIVPCGITDRKVGSVAELVGEAIDPHELFDIVHASLLKEFSEVFQLSLQPHSSLDLAIVNNRTLDNVKCIS